jgi:O-antigen/teichoic acid export membrane protein
MSLLKRLVSDTAVYGTSSILARGLNYLLTFLIASLIPTADFGVFTDLYAMVGFMLVLLTHGMETSFFRHINILDRDKNVFGTAFLSVTTLTTIFLALTLVFLQPIANGLRYPDQTSYIAIFSFIIFFDVLSAIPFANLRHLGKAKRFAAIKIINILLTILLNVFFLIVCPWLIENGQGGFSGWITGWYDDANRVLYVFLANLIASAATFLMLSPGLRSLRFRVEPEVYRRMLVYALPIMVMGFAGVINEMFDRKILRFLLPYDDAENLRLVGIYGFAYKLSMIMSLFLQAYRYAVEPILFSEAKDEQAPKAYAAIMNYYTMAATLLFLVIIFNLPLLEYILFDRLDFNADYRASFRIVPVLLAANGFLGIYFNVSTWYKVSDKTVYGALIALFGAAITIALNVWLVPQFGYVASAWTTLVCYVSMTALGLFIGQRHYPIPYAFGRLALYFGLALAFYALFYLLETVGWYACTAASALILIAAAGIVRKNQRRRA